MSLVDLINDYSVTTLNSSDTTTQDLDKDAFLQLLVKQLEYQDPLEPLQNEDFIAQLAQFNSLEQMMNLNDSFENLLMLQQLSQATDLIGRPVSYLDADGNMAAGVVDTTFILEGEPYLMVGDDEIGLDEVIGLSQLPDTDILSLASYLIGMEVMYVDYDGNEGSGTVNAVELVDGVAMIDIGEDEMIDYSCITGVTKASS